MVRYRSAIFITIIALAVSISGCTDGQDVTPIVKALPEVQQFLEEHPNAKIIVTYWSKEDVEKFEEEISRQCDKPITPAAMYKATVSEGNLKIISWISEENQKVICSITEGEGAEITAPAPTPAATPFTPATTAARVTGTAQVDYQSYCSENYPGSVYDPAKHKCIAYTTPIPTSTAGVDYQSYCSANYPGSIYDPAENACVYPQTSYSTPTQTPYYTSTPTQTSTGTTKGTITVKDVYETYAEARFYGGGGAKYAPVQGASVYIDGVFMGTTDSEGNLAVEIPYGLHTFKVSATGFIDANFEARNAYGYVALMYSTDVGRITFQVFDFYKTYGQVVQGASIYVDGALVGTTDSAGKLERILLSRGKHTFKVSATGFEDATSTQEGSDLNVVGYPGIANIYLKAKDVRVTFTVKNCIEGNPPQGASVYMDGVLIGTTDSQGYLQDVLVPRGMHTFKISATGFKDYTFDSAPGWFNTCLTPS